MSRNGSRNSLADPSRLKPLDEDDEEIVNVVIETPKGCRNKYAFDQDERAFRLKKSSSGRDDVPVRLRIHPIHRSG
jgi:hypothetical protein